MNDEIHQIRLEIFVRVLLGLVVIALVMAGVGLLTEGLSSSWFIRAIAILIVTVVAFVLRRFGRLVIASYVVVLQLLGLIAEMLLQSDAIYGAAPYLFIPVVIISGFLLSPLATFIIAVCAVIGVVILVAVTNRWSMAAMLYLLPPLGLTLLVAFLSAEGKRYTDKLSELLRENRELLKERTLELMGVKQKVETLQQQVGNLQRQQYQTETDVNQTQQLLAIQRDKRLFDLIKGTVGELKLSIEKFEEMIEQFGQQVKNTNLLGSVWRTLDHLRILTINLDEMADIDHGQIKLNYSELDIGRLLVEVVGTARALARGKDVQIRYQAPEKLPLIQADVSRLRQVLLHLLQNALKYTDQGIIEVQAELNEKEMIIFVSDTGIGMHREEATLIFEKFGRGSGALAKERQGSGLGLAISKRLIELHGGRMWVTSVLGIGSTFYLTLPLQAAREKSRQAATIINHKLLPAMPGAPQPASPGDDETVVTLPLPSSVLQPAISPPQPTLPDDDETIVTLPQETPTRVFEEPGATIIPEQISPKPVRPLVPPIQRYGPTYIRRFGLILLALLLVVLGIVGTLALVNLTIEQETIALNTPANGVELPEVNAPTPTNLIPSPTPLPLPTEPPQPTPTNSPVAPSPTVEQIAAATSTPASTPTAIPPTAIPTNTPEVPPTIPTNTATPTDTPAVPTPTPTDTPQLPAETGLGLSNFPRLTFAAGEDNGLSLAGLNFGNNVDLQSVENNRLSWSPTGRVLFAGERNGERDIFVTDNASAQPVRLTTAAGDDLQPAWSPDGSKIAFSSGRSGNFEIYVMAADGSNLAQLTDSRGFEEWPVWSPDGRQIAFISDRDGNAEIYVMDADGNNQQRITNNPADDWPAAWSPDGQWLVFASERDGNWNLYVVEAAGGPAQPLTDAPGDERDPIWSPDGQSIAFAYNQGAGWDIYTLPVATTDIRVVSSSEWSQITNTPGDERYPVWSQ